MKAPKEFYKNILNMMVPLHQFLGIELEDIEDGFAKMRIPFRPELIGDPRSMSIHGGIIATAMDSVGGAAAMTTLESMEDKISTIDIRIDYLRRGEAKDLFVEGTIARSGNRIVVTRMIAYQDNRDEHIAEGKAVYNVRRKKD